MRRQQTGLSLIELMISITLGLVLMTGVVQMFLTSRVTFSTQQAVSRIQESGRLAMEFMAQDVRMAGYMGCASRNPNITNGLTASTDYLYNLDEFVRGFEHDATALGSIDATDDTEVLVIRRASGDSVGLVEQHNAGYNANLRVNEEPDSSDCFFDGALCTGDLAIISDCTSGRLFRATGIGAVGGGAAGSGQIVHSAAGGGGGNPDPPTNDGPQLGGQQFPAGSEILAFNTITYFIAPSSFNQAGGAETSSLWKKVGERDAVELIEGVEDMQLEYGLDIDDDGIPEEYRDLGDMIGTDDWPDVQAVRLHLLLQSSEDNVLPEPQTLSFAGEEITFPDRRMRQVFVSTIGIRSRLN